MEKTMNDRWFYTPALALRVANRLAYLKIDHTLQAGGWHREYGISAACSRQRLDHEVSEFEAGHLKWLEWKRDEGYRMSDADLDVLDTLERQFYQERDYPEPPDFPQDAYDPEALAEMDREDGLGLSFEEAFDRAFPGKSVRYEGDAGDCEGCDSTPCCCQGPGGCWACGAEDCEGHPELDREAAIREAMFGSEFDRTEFVRLHAPALYRSLLAHTAVRAGLLKAARECVR